MIYKFAGAVLIIIASLVISNKTTFQNYFTYKYLETVVQVIQKVEYEKNSNITYIEIFKKIGFDCDKYIKSAEDNIYISDTEKAAVKTFITNLGKRDNFSENIFLKQNLEYFTNKRDEYFKSYKDNFKLYGITGVSFGAIISILLI